MSKKLLLLCIISIGLCSCSQPLASLSQASETSLKITKADPSRYLPQREPSSSLSSFGSHQLSLPHDIDLPPLPESGGSLHHGLLPPINGQPATVQSDQALPEIPVIEEEQKKSA